MTMREFIKVNKDEIDKIIKRANDYDYRITNEERKLWILNDESLYLWAYRSGVRI